MPALRLALSRWGSRIHSVIHRRSGRRLVFVFLCACSCEGSRAVVPVHRPPVTPHTAQPAYGDPVWLPDGSALLFNYRPLKRIYVDSLSGNTRFEFIDSLSGVWRVDPSGGNKRRVWGQMVLAPSVARDGSALYYENGSGQISRIALMGDSLDAASAVPVTNSPDGAFGPSMSPSGNRLLYFITSGSTSGIHITSPSGGPDRQVGAPDWYWPDWVPNDSGFVFQKGLVFPIVEVWIVDTSGVGASQLATNALEPRCSPDGSKIAFLSRDGITIGRGRLWVMNRDGSGRRQLTSIGLLRGYSWSPDGTEIAYVPFSDADYTYTNGTIWIINVETLSTRQVTFNPYP